MIVHIQAYKTLFETNIKQIMTLRNNGAAPTDFAIRITDPNYTVKFLADDIKHKRVRFEGPADQNGWLKLLYSADGLTGDPFHIGKARLVSDQNAHFEYNLNSILTTLNEDNMSPIGTFQTSKGSTYDVYSDGTTARNKMKRDTPGHENDFGAKNRSVKTIYLNQDASILSGAGMHFNNDAHPRLVIKGNRATFTWITNGKRGAAPSGRNIEFNTEPTIGLYPLELWQPRDDVPGYEAYATQHAGNQIVDLRMVKL